MSHSRRAFLKAAAATVGTAPLALAATPMLGETITPEQVTSLFDALPGEKAVKIFAPATDDQPEFLAQCNASTRVFVGSAIKVFVLGEALLQADSPTVVQTIAQKQLALNASVWSPDSSVFNPPNLTGLVSGRTTLEAMISHSDNTATDMAFKLVGPNNVRSFIASAGLKQTQVPDSTRVFIGYLLGAKNYKAFTWDQFVAATEADDPIVNPPLNNVETMASSADDFVSFYQRALQGEFFKNAETLNEFRRILTLAGAIYTVPLPLGVSAFLKGGSIDVPGFHALAIPGGMFFSNRWVYFSFTINWNAPGTTDPETVSQFIAAIRQALTLVFNALST
jgi:beta-lactamase class A